MPLVPDYGTFTEVRTHLKEVLDASARGQTVTMQRGGLVSVVMSAELLRTHLFRIVSSRRGYASAEMTATAQRH